MAEHYYTNAPTSKHEERHISAQIGNRCLRFETDAGTFSKEHMDPGSLLLINTVPALSGRVADIGCGWGAIGISLAVKNPDAFIEMVDVNERALALAQKNAEENAVRNVRIFASDALAQVEPGLSYVVTNPPIRAGKQVIYGFFAQAFEKLLPGGKLYIGEDAVMDVAGVADGEVTVGIRPEGFIPQENGPMVCDLNGVEVMGRDVSIVSRHKASLNPVVRSIVNADYKVDVGAGKVRYALKPHKVFLFDKKDEHRLYFEVK